MIENEAIKIVNEIHSQFAIHLTYFVPSCADERCEALRMAIQALEKQIPKKPKKNTNSNIYFCPVCERKVAHNHALYCSGCGQKLDWREDNEVN